MKIKWCTLVLLVVILVLSPVACGGGGYQLRVSVDGQGSVTPKSGAFPVGNEVTLTATPKSGWLFEYWAGDVSGSQNPIQITMDSDKAVTAYFLEYDYHGSDLSINTKTLPAWIEGTYGAASLNATGGTGKLSWRGTPPEPWLVLDPSGVLSGTAPILPAGTSMRIMAPFTVTVTDEARHAREATYTITILPKQPQITPRDITAIWDENDPPYNNILRLDATISSGYPPYRMGIPGSFGLPLGMKVEIDPDGIHIILKGPPPKAKFAEDVREFQICIVDSNNFEASADVKLVIKKAKPAEEVFEGTFSGPLGTMSSSSTGCQWSRSLSGTMTLTLVTNSDGTISGTANVPTDFGGAVIYSPPNVNCPIDPFSHTATGTVSGTNASFSGTFTSPGKSPLTIVFTGARSGDTITGSIAVSKSFAIFTNGVLESTSTLSTTISNIVLTKKP